MKQTNSSNDQLMTVGDFSRRSRLSLKALRLYDEIGILEPATVDVSTGYRYYRDDQVEQARLIGLLRQLGMPLDRIGRVVDLPPAAQATEVRRYWIELEGSMAVRSRLVDYLQTYLTGGGDAMYEIRTRNVPERKVLSIKRNVRQPELLDFLMEWTPGVAAVLDSAGVRHSIHSFVVYDGMVSEDSDGPVSVSMAFEGDIEVPAGMQAHVEPAHLEAYTTISKEQCQFPRILEAYDAVMAYVSDHGEASGSPREVYFVDIDAVGPDDPFCDIALPMTPAAQLVR
jgi:DNA-binding transcriptional MerR regulator